MLSKIDKLNEKFENLENLSVKPPKSLNDHENTKFNANEYNVTIPVNGEDSCVPNVVKSSNVELLDQNLQNLQNLHNVQNLHKPQKQEFQYLQNLQNLHHDKNVKNVQNTKTVNSSSNLKFTKYDIRNFGKIGQRTENLNESQRKQHFIDRVEFLRSKKPQSGIIPDVADRLIAGQVLDKLEHDQAIFVDNSECKEMGKAQMLDKLAIIGADVKSLFPSMKNIETARLARHAILNSKVNFENFDYLMALRYIFINGGKNFCLK